MKKQPEQYKVDYNSQYSNKYNYIDTNVKLSRDANELLHQVGDNLVIQGFDITDFNRGDDAVTVELCQGSLIIDSILIHVLENINLSLDTYDLNFNQGYIIIYTKYKHLPSTEQNELPIYIQYIYNDGSNIDLDDDFCYIVLDALELDTQTNKLQISNKAQYNIGECVYYFKGHTNYNLTGIYQDWSQYLDFFNTYDIRRSFYDHQNETTQHCDVKMHLYTNVYVDVDGPGYVINNKYNFDSRNTSDSMNVLKGEEVILEPKKLNSNVDIIWSGCDYIDDNKCIVRSFNDKQISVIFQEYYILTINKNGEGNIFSYPIGIDNETLSVKFPKNTRIILSSDAQNVTWPDNSTEQIYIIDKIDKNMTINVSIGE